MSLNISDNYSFLKHNFQFSFKDKINFLQVYKPFIMHHCMFIYLFYLLIFVNIKSRIIRTSQIKLNQLLVVKIMNNYYNINNNYKLYKFFYSS